MGTQLSSYMYLSECLKSLILGLGKAVIWYMYPCRACCWWFSNRMMCTGSGERKGWQQRASFYCLAHAVKQMFFMTSPLWLMWLPIPSPPPSSSLKGAGFDMCRDMGRKSTSTLCVLERKNSLIFPSLPDAPAPHLLCFFTAGPDVSLCSGFQGWLGQYYV